MTMNIKPFYQQVIAAVKKSQDNECLSVNDEYGKLLISLIQNNTQTMEGDIDRGEVDTEQLAIDLNYAIDQFTKALNAIEKFNQ